jgi:hypothetical protein
MDSTLLFTLRLVRSDKYLGRYLLDASTNSRKAPILFTILTTVGIYVGFEVFTAVNMVNAVFWDIKTQFVPHRRHITSPLQSPAG